MIVHSVCLQESAYSKSALLHVAMEWKIIRLANTLAHSLASFVIVFQQSLLPVIQHALIQALLSFPSTHNEFKTAGSHLHAVASKLGFGQHLGYAKDHSDTELSQECLREYR